MILTFLKVFNNWSKENPLDTLLTQLNNVTNQLNASHKNVTNIENLSNGSRGNPSLVHTFLACVIAATNFFGSPDIAQAQEVSASNDNHLHHPQVAQVSSSSSVRGETVQFKVNTNNGPSITVTMPKELMPFDNRGKENLKNIIGGVFGNTIPVPMCAGAEVKVDLEPYSTPEYSTTPSGDHSYKFPSIGVPNILLPHLNLAQSPERLDEYKQNLAGLVFHTRFSNDPSINNNKTEYYTKIAEQVEGLPEGVSPLFSVLPTMYGYELSPTQVKTIKNFNERPLTDQKTQLLDIIAHLQGNKSIELSTEQQRLSKVIDLYRQIAQMHENDNKECNQNNYQLVEQNTTPSNKVENPLPILLIQAERTPTTLNLTKI